MSDLPRPLYFFYPPFLGNFSSESGFCVLAKRCSALSFCCFYLGLFKTVDGGNSWLEMETLPARNITGIAISPSFSSDGMIALATYDGGVYVSRDSGKRWIAHNVGLPSTHLWDISIVRHDKDPLAMYALSNKGFLKSRGAFQSWSLNRLATSKYWKHVTANFEADSIVTRVARRFLGRPKQSFPTQIAVSANLRSPNTLYLGTRYKGVLKSGDGGSTWVQPWSADNGWVPSVQMSPNYDADTTVLASVRFNGIFRSTDGGNSWQQINAGLSPLAVSYSGLGTWAIAISPEFAKDRRIYYGTADGLYSFGAQGKTWERIKVSEHRQRELIRAISVSPNFGSDDTMFVSVKGRGLYKSTDRGESFSAIATGLIRNHEVMRLFRFSPDYSNDHTIFAASAEEVFISDDSGISWKRLERPIRYEDTKENITYYGEWIRERNDAYSGGTIHRSNDPGAGALFHFAGREVTWFGPKSDEYGVANVFLDSQLVDTVQQYSSEPTNVAPIITIRDVPSGAHTLSIEITNAADKESATGFIAIDALEVF